jgi:hypothetical protein
MSNPSAKEWLVPASIPFAELKGRDLEECVYWLFDAMGAKDLEWRTGGSGGGAADGARDLEASFYTPVGDGEIEAQKWWIECKGRTGTVEPDAVKAAVNNAAAIDGLDYIVIATNTQFSNPTLEWVKAWQGKNPRPKVKLWDRSQLERYLSRHPDVVLRLFSEALSLQGRFQAMEIRFWNKLEFTAPGTRAALWKSRDQIEITVMGMFAAIANEFASGGIVSRPWAASLGIESLSAVLYTAFQNIAYLAIRCTSAGVDQKIIFRSLAYLILVALDRCPADYVTDLIIDALNRGKKDFFPDEVQEVLLMPVVHQLLAEIQDVCSSKCERMMPLDRAALPQDEDEVDDYWLRLEKVGTEEESNEPRRFVRIENFNAPCVVGFPVDKDNGCPLFSCETNVKNTGTLLAVIKRVIAFRKAQAAEKRRAEKLADAQRRAKTRRKLPTVTTKKQ